MAKGRKPTLVTQTNLVTFESQSITQQPLQLHYEQAAQLKPVGMTDDEAAIYDQIAPILAMLGRLLPQYMFAVQDICYIRNQINQTRQLLEIEGKVFEVDGRNGVQVKARPEVAQLNELHRTFRSLINEFGLAPASERSVKNSADTALSAFDAF